MNNFEAKFGFLPKKKVILKGDSISIGKNEFALDDIQCIYYRPFNFSKNEWGSVYFSFDGEKPEQENLFAKNVFNFTNGQTSAVNELLALLDIKVINTRGDFKSQEKGEDLELQQRQLDEKRERTQAKIAAMRDKKEMSKKIICPNCQSTDVSFMGNDRKSFSVGKAAAGTILTGGVGALAGFTGKKGKNQWFCKNCNQVFETKK